MIGSAAGKFTGAAVLVTPFLYRGGRGGRGPEPGSFGNTGRVPELQ